MPKVGGRRKKIRSHRQPDATQERLIPKTFIFKKGKCSLTCRDFTRDIRKCFYPHTAMKMQDSNRIGIKTYLRAAKYYSVTHLLAFQQTKEKSLLRIIRVGGGQMRFRIMNYCRMKDILKNGGQPFSITMNQPLVVLNGFNTNKQTQKIGKAIQEMFPPLIIEKAKISSLKRVVSFTYQPNKKVIYFRHYKITKNQGGLTSTFKNIINNVKKIDFSAFKSFSEAFGQAGQQAQGSEFQQTVKLQQIGPRMKLKFFDYIEGIGRHQEEEQYQQQQPEQENQQNQAKNKQKQQVEQKMEEQSPEIQEL